MSWRSKHMTMARFANAGVSSVGMDFLQENLSVRQQSFSFGLPMRIGTEGMDQMREVKRAYGKMPYAERLRHYEAEKKELEGLSLSASEYRRQVIALAKKWNI